MNYFSIDLIIIYVFLLITLIIGLLAGRDIKNIRDYAIANKQFGTGVLTMTMLATYITGSKGIGYVGYIFDDGILPVFFYSLLWSHYNFLIHGLVYRPPNKILQRLLDLA